MVLVELNNFGLGALMLKKSKEEIKYQPFEISRYGLGIITSQPLDIGSDLVLKSSLGEVPFRVSTQIPASEAGSLRYRLVALDMEADVEQFILDVANNEKVAALTLTKNLQHARFDTDPPIPVIAKTFGSTNRYRFQTVNVSTSGILMALDDEITAPFNINTLLELELIPNGVWLHEPLSCLGKVIRRNTFARHSGQSPVVSFGIQFLEFQKDDLKVWQAILKDIERHLLLSNKLGTPDKASKAS